MGMTKWIDDNDKDIEEMSDKEFENAEINVSAGRSEKFVEAANALSAYIKELDLTAEQNDKLIQLMVEQVLVAEKDAFLYGANGAIGLMTAAANDGMIQTAADDGKQFS